MKRNKELYYIFFLVALIIVVVFVLIIPNMKKISLIAGEVMKNQSRLEQLQRSGQDKKEALDNYYIVKENLPKLKNIISQQGEELSFITNLEAIAEQNNLNQEINIYLENNESNQQDNSNGKIALPFQLILDGNFYNFLTFLRDLELSEYYLNIEKIQITHSKSTYKSYFTEEIMVIDPNDVHVVLNGISYWQ